MILHLIVVHDRGAVLAGGGQTFCPVRTCVVRFVISHIS